MLLTEAEAPEGNFPINIVDLALLATQNKELELDKAIWDLISGNVKIAVTVFYNSEKLDLLAVHFALEDSLIIGPDEAFFFPIKICFLPTTKEYHHNFGGIDIKAKTVLIKIEYR